MLEAAGVQALACFIRSPGFFGTGANSAIVQPKGCTPTVLAFLFILAQSSTSGLLAADLPRVPAGFTITRVTAPEQVQHPLMACFDDRGRLYVCESAGTNAKAADLLKTPQDKIVRLEDSDGDGGFDKSVVFADKLVFPQGVLWHEGVVYTCSSPYLWKLEDTDDDGVCDKRTILVKSFGFSGNAADIHGPFLGPEGRLWWCDGRHGHEIRTDDKGLAGGPDNAVDIPPKPEPGLPNPDGKLLSKGKAARIFNCRLDGSDVQTFCGGGMDNPVEIDFWETDVIGTVNLFYGTPRGDCLVHWLWGGVYPKADQQECIAEFPRTVGLLDEVANYGHVAVSGMCKYRGSQFGEGWDKSVFVALFNTHKVVRTTLERSGSTFKAITTEDFVVFDDPDSHPTDVLEDADGSLLVVETGGWFRIGCPASQVAKPQIGGAIYRIRKEGAPHIKDPFGQAVDWKKLPPSELARLRKSASSVISNKAWDELRRRVDAGELDTNSLGFFSGFGVDLGLGIGKVVMQWIELHDGRIPEGFRLEDLVVGMRAFEEEPDPGSHRISYEALAKLSRLPEVRKTLANAKLNPTSFVFDGLQKLEPDRPLLHSAIYAVLQMRDVDTIRSYLSDGSRLQKRVALIALDQIDDGRLQRDEVIALLGNPSSDAELQRTVFDVVSRREGWASGVIDLIGQWLNQSPIPDDRRAIICRFLAERAGEPSVQALIAAQLGRPNLTVDSRNTLLEAIVNAKVAALPDGWATGLRSALNADAVAQRLVIAAALRHKIPELTAALDGVVENKETPVDVCIAAMDVLNVRDQKPLADERFEFLRQQIDSDTDPVLTATAARILADSPLTQVQLIALTSAFDSAHSLLAPTLLRAYANLQDAAVATALLKQLNVAGDSLSLPASELGRVFATAPENVQQLAAPLLAARGVDPVRQAARLAELTDATKTGNAKAGREVFFSNKALCSRCHRVNGQGETIGPDLSMVGAIRQHHELVEAVVEPSASFVRSYRPVILATADGRTHTGVISSEASTEVTLRTAEFAELRIPRKEIEAFKESDVSIMPAGVDQRLSRTELADLIAYLASLKERKP
jgi:putative heme-binding domain-containing protein